MPELSGASWYSAHCQAIKAARRHADKANDLRFPPARADYHAAMANMLTHKAIAFLERAQSHNERNS